MIKTSGYMGGILVHGEPVTNQAKTKGDGGEQYFSVIFREKILPNVFRRKIPAKIHRAVPALNKYLSFLTSAAKKVSMQVN
jgi:hypothetical protein